MACHPSLILQSEVILASLETSHGTITFYKGTLLNVLLQLHELDKMQSMGLTRLNINEMRFTLELQSTT
jgi:hypothetical protein